jgi:hypothetical protein
VTILVQSNGHASGTTNTSVSVTLNSQPQSGNTLIAYCASNVGARTFTVSDNVNGSWTIAVSHNSRGTIAIAYFLNAAASTPTVTATISGAAVQLGIIVEEWGNTGIPTALDVTTGNDSGGVSGTTGTTGTTSTLAQTSELVVAACVTQQASGTPFVCSIPYVAGGSSQLAITNGGLATANLQPNTTTGQNVTFTWPNTSTWAAVIATFETPAAALLGQSSTFQSGNFGVGTAEPITNQSITATAGTVSPNQTIALGSQTILINEGIVFAGVLLAGQAATFSQGTITVTEVENITLSLSGQTAQFAEGTLSDNIGYILDQGSIIVVGQTATFTEGTIVAEVDVFPGAFTVTSSEGTISTGTLSSITLGAQTIVSSEGSIVAQSGSNLNITLASQAINSSQGAIAFTPTYTFSAQNLTAVEGTITFSNVGNNFLLGAQTITATEGLLFVTGPPPGTGPPLFIPPTLGKPVTTRTFSWAEMAMRAWGSEFRAPDHRIYQFSGGNYKDSTDLGTTGIYNPNLGPADNP